MASPRTAPLRCLLAEDQALIGMLVEDCLRDLGLDVVGPITSCAEALAWLRENTPDVALIDYMLADGPCLELGHELGRRGVPFAVLSGYDAKASLDDPVFAAAPWLGKPASEDALRGVVSGLTAEWRQTP